MLLKILMILLKSWNKIFRKEYSQTKVVDKIQKGFMRQICQEISGTIYAEKMCTNYTKKVETFRKIVRLQEKCLNISEKCWKISGKMWKNSKKCILFVLAEKKRCDFADFEVFRPFCY